MERAPSTNLIEGWVGPRASMDAAKRKNPYPCQQMNPDHPVCSLVTIPTQLSWLL
jgi:hypothetical protein